MDDRIVAGVEDAQVGVRVEPADDVELRVVRGAVAVEPRPGVGREGEVTGPWSELTAGRAAMTSTTMLPL